MAKATTATGQSAPAPTSVKNKAPAAPKKRKRTDSSASAGENPAKRAKLDAPKATKPKETEDPMVVEAAAADVSDAESEVDLTAGENGSTSVKSLDESISKAFERAGEALGKAHSTLAKRKLLPGLRGEIKTQVKGLKTKTAQSLKDMDAAYKKRFAKLEAKIAAVETNGGGSSGSAKAQDYSTKHFGSKAASSLAIRQALHAQMLKDIAAYNAYLAGVEAGEDPVKTRPPNNRVDPPILGMVRSALLYLAKNDTKVGELFGAADEDDEVDENMTEEEIRERDAQLQKAEEENETYAPGDEETMYDKDGADEGEDDSEDESEEFEVDPEEAKKELADLMDDSIDEEAEKAARAKDEKLAAAAAAARENAAESDDDGLDDVSDDDAEEFKPARGTEVADPVWLLTDGRYRDCIYQIVDVYGELVLGADGKPQIIPEADRETCDKDE